MESADKYEIALNKAMALCSEKEQCNEDIRTKLISWGITGSEAEKILLALGNERFIDERRYSGAFARDKFRYNKWGKLKIAAHLKNKRIPSDIIRESLNSIEPEAYLMLLKNLLEAQKKKIKARDDYELKGKLARYAMSKGFESGLVFEVLEDRL